jgi:hypothetical protein
MQNRRKGKGGEGRQKNFILQKAERWFLSLSDNKDIPGNEGPQTLGPVGNVFI